MNTDIRFERFQPCYLRICSQAGPSVLFSMDTFRIYNFLLVGNLDIFNLAVPLIQLLKRVKKSKGE